MIKKLKQFTKASTPRIGLALGSGGARGIAHIAFLKIFDELGLKPHMISGCSIGALIGALYCSGVEAKDMEKYFSDLKLKDIQRLTDLVVHKSGFIKGEKALLEISKAMKCKTFKSLKIPLKVIATDFYEGREIVFDSGDILRAVRASCSIPGIFIPVEYKNKILVDGGIVNPVPYDQLSKECDYVIAIDVTEGTATNKREEDKRNKKTPTVHELIYNTYEIVQLNIVNNMVKINPPNLYIKPEVNSFNIMEFNKGREILDAVKLDTDKLKAELKHLLKLNARN